MKLIIQIFALVLVIAAIHCEYIKVGNVYQWRDEEPLWSSENEEVAMGHLSTQSQSVKGEVSFFGEKYLKIHNFTFEGIECTCTLYFYSLFYSK